MKKMFEITEETVDGIVRDTLISDYKSIRQDIRRLLNKQGPLLRHEIEDLNDSMKFAAGFEAILKYYLLGNEYDELMEDVGFMVEPQEFVDEYEPCVLATGCMADFDDTETRLDRIEENIKRLYEIVTMKADYNRNVDL